MLPLPDNYPLVFDHIGIVTSDIDRAALTIARMFGANEFTARIDDEILGVSARFVRDPSRIVYELISPFGETSPVAKTLAAKSNLLNQVAYRTKILAKSAAILRESGCLPLGPAKPAKAFGGASVQFFWSELGFIIELIETDTFTHSFSCDEQLILAQMAE